MMALEADRMRNLILTDAVIGPERDVVLEERRSRIEGDPESLLSEEVQATLYQNHPYRVPVIGWMHEMEKLNRTDAVAFYNQYYTPNNAVLVVAGDVEPDQVRKLAEETYSKVARGPDLPPRNRPTEPEQNTSRTVTMTDPRVSASRSFARYWLAPSYRTAEPGEAEALDLLVRDPRWRNAQPALPAARGQERHRGRNRRLLRRHGARRDQLRGLRLPSRRRGPRQARDLDQRRGRPHPEGRCLRRRVAEGQEPAGPQRMIFAQDSPSSMANMYGSALTTGSTVKDVQA